MWILSLKKKHWNAMNVSSELLLWRIFISCEISEKLVLKANANGFQYFHQTYFFNNETNIFKIIYIICRSSGCVRKTLAYDVWGANSNHSSLIFGYSHVLEGKLNWQPTAVSATKNFGGWLIGNAEGL